MKYRLLEENEWHLLEPLFLVNRKPVPPQNTSMAAVAEDAEGHVCACLLLQVALHMEPLMIANPHASFRGLQQVLDNALPPNTTYHCHTNGDKMERITELCGFKRTGDFWTKELP